MSFSYHVPIVLLGITIAGLTFFGAVTVGPDARRGLRLLLGTLSFVAFLGSAVWFVSYLSFIEQRRGIEVRLADLRAQAFNSGSILACLERNSNPIEAACGQRIFSSPETVSAASLYTASRLDVLIAAARYRGPRTTEFEDQIVVLDRALNVDLFGLTSNVLMVREGCVVERCDIIALFHDSTELWNNIRQKTFDKSIAHYAAWASQVAPGARQPAQAPSASAAASIESETRAPIPERYALPSAASIPPVSIMDEEPPDRPVVARPRVKERATGSIQQPSASSPPAEQSPASLPIAAAPARRERTRQSAPLAISPVQ